MSLVRGRESRWENTSRWNTDRPQNTTWSVFLGSWAAISPALVLRISHVCFSSFSLVCLVRAAASSAASASCLKPRTIGRLNSARKWSREPRQPGLAQSSRHHSSSYLF